MINQRRVMNQVDHRQNFFKRLAAGKVEQSKVPVCQQPPAQRPVKPKTDAAKPMSLAEQLGLLALAKQAKMQKPRKRVVAPIVVTPDKPRIVAMPKVTPPIESPAAPAPPPPVPDIAAAEPVEPAEPAASEEEPAAAPKPPIDLFQDIR